MALRAFRAKKTFFAVMLLNVALLVFLGSLLAEFLASPYEITRLRNSLIFEVGTTGDFDWTPRNLPADFRYEKRAAPALFEELAETVVATPAEHAGLGAGLSIARHLASGPGPGEGIRSDTLTTYATIMNEARGYCSDYTQVFNALAIAAAVPVREWGMSFDGYSGEGHAFSEVYSDELEKWVLIDSFYSFYVADAASEVPLSVLELRERLRDGEAAYAGIDVIPILPERFAFRNAAAALDYYQRGADQMFLYFGNDVYSYDESVAVDAFGGYSRALEQALAILLGDHPRIKLIASETNRAAIRHLEFLRLAFLGGLALGAIAFFLLAYQLLLWRRLRRAGWS